jgi:transposase
VASPSLSPKKRGDDVNTNRRDAVSLARLSRARRTDCGLGADEPHEAMRDLACALQKARNEHVIVGLDLTPNFPSLGE